jgi:hypothetical protein
MMTNPQEPTIKGDLVELVAEIIHDHTFKASDGSISEYTVAKAVLAALTERGQVMHEGGQKIHVNFPFLVLQMEATPTFLALQTFKG